MKSIAKELIGASAILIILSVLQHGDSYGYEIVQRVKQLTNGKVTWKEASIYPVLKRLETGGLVKSYWKLNKKERPRRYYTILSDGKKQLEYNKQEWEMMYNVFQNLWNPA